MAADGTKAEILEHFLEHCCRSTQMRLGCIEADKDVYNSPSELAEIVSALTDRFTIESLVRAGVFVGGPSETVALAPALMSGTSIVVLRDAITRMPYELLTDAGCLGASALPIFEVLRDGRTKELIEQGTGDLFVAFDVEHVVMLRACGLPATLAVGLDSLPLESIDQFCEVFELDYHKSDRVFSREEIARENGNQSEYHPNDPIRRVVRNLSGDSDGSDPNQAARDSATNSSAEPIQSHLVFLGWTPVELSTAVPLQLKAVIDHLLQLKRFMGMDLHDIGLWEVEQETIERLRFIAASGSAPLFKDAFLDAAESIEVSIVQFGQERQLAIGPPNDYATALARLHECASGESRIGLPSSDRKKEAWRDVQRLLNQQVVGPVRELALASSNPVERNLLMGFAELSNVFHMQSVVIGERLNGHIADRGSEVGGQFPEDQFKNLMEIADRMISMARATDKWNQPQTTIIASRTIDSKSFPRLPHSA